jgi:hypothetical protein
VVGALVLGQQFQDNYDHEGCSEDGRNHYKGGVHGWAQFYAHALLGTSVTGGVRVLHLVLVDAQVDRRALQNPGRSSAAW